MASHKREAWIPWRSCHLKPVVFKKSNPALDKIGWVRVVMQTG